MAVTNNATLIEDHETAPTYTSIGGGQGAASDADFSFLGALGSSRKMSNVTKNGFWFTDATVHDVSASGTHVKLFMTSVTPGNWTDFWIRLGSTQTAYEEHNPGVGFFDNVTGGWTPIWIEVDAGTDTGTPDFTIIDEWAILCSMSTISSNLKNFNTDQSHYSTRPVLLWDSTGGDLDDFITTESTAGTGTLTLRNGIYTCFSNLKMGSATSTTFDMAGKTIAFPDATWLPSASTWMGLDFDLAHASTVITATGGSVISGNPTGASARKPDIIVAGTSGTVDFTGRVFDGMRVITFTTGVTAQNCTFANCGRIDAVGADLAGSVISGYEGAVDSSAMSWTTAVDPNGELDNMSITKSTAATHAIEFGTSSPLTMTLTGIDFSGYNTSDAQNDSTFHVLRTSGTVTINITGGSGNVSFKTAGATVVIVQNPVTLTLTVTDIGTGSPISGARARVEPSDNTGPFPFEETVTITRSGATATVTHTSHGMANTNKVFIQGANEVEYNGTFTITNVSANAYDYTVSGSPATPATGTIDATAVLIDGTTNGSGVVTDTRTYGSNQPITGRVRHSSSAPFYKTSPITGTVDSSAGLSISVQMIRDE